MTAEFPASIDDLVVHPTEIIPGSIVRKDHLEQALFASNLQFRNCRTYWSSTGSIMIPAFDTAPLEEVRFTGKCQYDPDTQRILRFVFALDVGVSSTITVRVTVNHVGGAEVETSAGLTTDQYLAIDVEDVDPGAITWTVEFWSTAGATDSYCTKAVCFDSPWELSGGDPDPALPNPSS